MQPRQRFVRSRNGCKTCKARRKKCDETTPICNRCARGGYECLGYDVDTKAQVKKNLIPKFALSLERFSSPDEPPRVLSHDIWVSRHGKSRSDEETTSTSSTDPAVVGKEPDPLDFLSGLSGPSIHTQAPSPAAAASLLTAASPPSQQDFLSLLFGPTSPRYEDENGVCYPSLVNEVTRWDQLAPSPVPCAIDSFYQSPPPASATIEELPSAEPKEHFSSLMSFLSGPSVFTTVQNEPAPSPESEVSTAASIAAAVSDELLEGDDPILCGGNVQLVRVGRVFASDSWNTLLELYTMFYTRMFCDWWSMRVDIADIVREKALKGAVLRNAMFSLAALFQSYRQSSVLAWKQQALHFNHNARTLLVQEISRPEIPVREKLAGVIEILIFEWSTRTCRAETSRSLLEQGRRYILAAHASDPSALNLTTYPPSLNLASFRGVYSIYTALFSWFDIVSSILLARPTLLTYEIRPIDNRTFGLGADACRIALDNIICCPTEIVVCFARSSNIRAIIDSEGPQNTTSCIWTLAADHVENDILSWKPPSAPSGTDEQERAIAQEIWQYTALIYHYQAVRRAGALHPVVSSATERVIALCRMIPATSKPGGYLSLPYFLCGSNLLRPADRTFIGRRLRRFSHASMAEYLAVLEEVWQKTDLTGRPADWMEIMRSRPPMAEMSLQP